MNSVANEMLERIGNKKISESFAMPITIALYTPRFATLSNLVLILCSKLVPKQVFVHVTSHMLVLDYSTHLVSCIS